MTSFLTQWRRLRWLVGLVAFFVILTIIPITRGALTHILVPVALVLRHGGDGVVSGFTTVRAIPSLAKDNAALTTQVTELQALKVTNAELEHENDLLRKELNFSKSDTTKTLIAAQVISRTASVSQQSLLVDKGTNDGFISDMAVVSQGYYIGKVQDATATTSTVVLVTSPASILPVELQQSRSVGILKGGPSGLILDEIPRDVTINPNEAVITAPLGSVVKSGLPVGTVASVISSKSDVFQTVRLTSPIDFSRLEIVFGVK